MTIQIYVEVCVRTSSFTSISRPSTEYPTISPRLTPGVAESKTGNLLSFCLHLRHSIGDTKLSVLRAVKWPRIRGPFLYAHRDDYRPKHALRFHSRTRSADIGAVTSRDVACKGLEGSVRDVSGLMLIRKKQHLFEMVKYTVYVLSS